MEVGALYSRSFISIVVLLGSCQMRLALLVQLVRVDTRCSLVRLILVPASSVRKPHCHGGGARDGALSK